MYVLPTVNRLLKISIMKIYRLSLITICSLFLIWSCEPKKKVLIDATDKVEIGYGSQRASNKTTAVDHIKNDSENPQNLTLADMLRRVPGVRVSGQGSNVEVYIRGASSLEGNNQPLYVLDGSPIGNDYALVERRIDLNDIESVSVLRDSGAAVYGSRATGGVVLITSKKG